MTFPWRKAKSTLLSRLVTDLHRHPKIGGVLVLETGFPTSLVDLIVKNRDRFRKSPKRKSTSQILTPLTDKKLESSRIDVGKSVMVRRECADDFRVGFRAAFKVIVVAALAGSTKQLTLWIMVVAVLLLLSDFVGASVFPGSVDRVKETWIVESESSCVGETEMETRRERSELSRSGRFKRHLIKKLVPKKLRHGKKKEEDQRRTDMNKRDELEDESEELKTPRVDQVLCVKEEKLERGSSGQCLSAIVLAGLLLGGRGAALLITLLWCLMLPYIRRLGC